MENLSAFKNIFGKINNFNLQIAYLGSENFFKWISAFHVIVKKTVLIWKYFLKCNL